MHILDFKISDIPSREKNKEHHQIMKRGISKESRSKAKQHLFKLHFSSQHTPNPEIKPAYDTQQSSVSLLSSTHGLFTKSISAEISWITTLLLFCLCGMKNMNIKAQTIGVLCTKPTEYTHGKGLLTSCL